MKRWVALTVAIYLAMLILLTVPVAWLAFGQTVWGETKGASLNDILSGFQEVGYWAWLLVMGMGQALLLLAPVKVAQRRLTPRRPLLVPILTTTFFLGMLLLSGILSVLCVLFKDKSFNVFSLVGQIAVRDVEQHPLLKSLFRGPTFLGASGFDYVFGIVTMVAICWVLWALLFYFFASSDDPNALVKRGTRWLLRGSILELLVAVPSHIIVRNRNDCCAPFGTFWGITTGLSVMLMCFGPGVFFLFAERFARLKPNDSAKQNAINTAAPTRK